jgi:aspartyl-tRNA(Asn)/glutamyl-tRNA(Gln) amidotransferase subunit A
MKSIAALLGDLSAGRTDAQALAQDSLGRIRREDAKIRSFIAIAGDAQDQARVSDERRASGRAGPLEGIPVAVKDNLDVAGMPTTNGARPPGRKAERDAAAVARLRAAGAVIIGKLNMHEGALGATTDNPFHGRCENPLAPGLTPGGSSGGSAAAVAAGFVPLSLGTDTMGSVRIPAAYCGLYGLKPTRGLVGRSGLHHLSWTLDTIGPIATTPRDLETALAAIAGHDPRDPQSLDIDLDRRPAPPLKSLCLAAVDHLGTELEPVVRDTFESFVDRLRGAGVAIRRVSVDGWEPPHLRRSGLLVSEAEAAELLSRDQEGRTELHSEGFLAMLDYGRRAAGSRIMAAYRQLLETCPALLATLGDADALIMPTAPQRAFPHGSSVPESQADLTAIANASGLPSIAIPVRADDGGLPCSVQLVGRAFSDWRLIAIAGLMAEASHAG